MISSDAINNLRKLDVKNSRTVIRLNRARSLHSLKTLSFRLYFVKGVAYCYRFWCRHQGLPQ